MHDSKRQPFQTSLAENRVSILGRGPMSNRVVVQLNLITVLQRILQPHQEVLRRLLWIIAGVAAREIRTSENAAVERLAYMQFRLVDHPVQERLRRRLRVYEQACFLRHGQRDVFRREERDAADAAGQHNMVGPQHPALGDDAAHTAVFLLDEARHRVGEHLRTPGLGFLYEEQRRVGRLGGALLIDVNTPFREVAVRNRRLQLLDLRLLHADNVVAPRGMLFDVRFELLGRLVPAQRSSPVDRETRKRTVSQFPPVVHGVVAQVVVELRVAGSGIDPSEGVGSCHATQVRGDDRHLGFLREVPGNRGADNAAADDDDIWGG